MTFQDQTAQKGKKKSLIVNAFVMMCRYFFIPLRQVTDKTLGSGHQSPGLWRHPEDESWRFKDTEHWVELAKLLEDAKFHGIFIADVLGK
jgi:alkanesulfonate monooxygenase